MTHAKHVVTLADGRTARLGRVRPKSRPKALRFGAYFDTATTTWVPPASLDYSPKALAALIRMYLNDVEGDCVIAGKLHAVGVWTGNETGVPAVATDAEAQAAYVTICGPGDQGCNITDVLDYFQATGLTLSGVVHRIDGYVSVNWTSKLQVQAALYLFGALTVGINLPEAWTTAQVWDVTNTPIVGGHDVTIVGYNATGPTLCSWGQLFQMTWAALASTKWVEEMYAMLAGDWYGSAKLAPCGVDAADLAADLAKIGGGSIPPIVVGPVVPPTPIPTPVPGAPTPTSVGLSVPSASVAFGQPVTVSAVADPATGVGIPSGDVVFDVDGSGTAQTVALGAVNGLALADLVLTGLGVGPHRVVASYKGSAMYAPSPENWITFTVAAAPPVTPPPPAVIPGLTLAQAIAAMSAGINDARPFGPANIAVHAIAAGTAGLRAAWPHGAP